ncbi:hypothetical protein KUCAC02_007252 [Chaenocephalus aceratus]|uniref:Uncharacterized protein n=1 Tax=Chaenocephalus aceratus TaxID=36190 RepID=A0ACB9X5S0_CHAAC|nr:hypothetical protein KUCAC02_007252 [Chaenocephalus aceratus]
MEVCDTILGHTRERFSFTHHLVSATLLQGDRCEEFKMASPEDALRNTLKAYPMLNRSKLKTESHLQQLFMENNLEQLFSETVTLLKILITTTPMTMAEAERCFSTLKRIQTFLRNTMTQERLNACCLVKEKTDFNQKVIEKCAGQKERRATFIFK